LRSKIEMSDREKMVDLLGSMFHQAARASVAKGAQYAPGENISTDAEGAWKLVAETLVRIAESGAISKAPVKTE
jgi:hypothetical protein